MRSSMGLVCPFTLALALALPVAAQRIWIVDANGGGDHREISFAVNSAANGDTVVVRAGNYVMDSAIVGKDLRLLAEANVRTYGVLTIANVPAGRTVAVEGFATGSSLPWNDPRPFQVVVSNCAATVVLERLELTRPAAFPSTWRPAPPPGLTISGSANVVVSASTVIGGPAVSMTSSTVTFLDARIYGASASVPDGFYTLPAVVASASTITVSGGVVGGGSAVIDGQWIPTSPRVAMELTGCDVVATGDAQTRILGGAQWGGGGLRTNSIDASGGTIVADPRVTLTTFPRLRNGATFVAESIPGLLATAGTPGTNVVLRHVDTPGATAPIFVSLPAAATATPFGDLWLDLPTAILLHAGTVPPDGAIDLTLPLTPAFPRGLALTFQSASTAGGGLRLSNAATTILH